MEQGFGFAHFILQCDAMGKGCAGFVAGAVGRKLVFDRDQSPSPIWRRANGRMRF